MAELRMFIFRQEVLKLYRSFQRITRLAPPESQRAQIACMATVPRCCVCHARRRQDGMGSGQRATMSRLLGRVHAEPTATHRL